MAEPRFNVGDTVRVVATTEDIAKDENGDEWVSDMDATRGKKYVVRYVCTQDGVLWYLLEDVMHSFKESWLRLIVRAGTLEVQEEGLPLEVGSWVSVVDNPTDQKEASWVAQMDKYKGRVMKVAAGPDEYDCYDLEEGGTFGFCRGWLTEVEDPQAHEDKESAEIEAPIDLEEYTKRLVGSNEAMLRSEALENFQEARNLKEAIRTLSLRLSKEEKVAQPASPLLQDALLQEELETLREDVLDLTEQLERSQKNYKRVQASYIVRGKELGTLQQWAASQVGVTQKLTSALKATSQALGTAIEANPHGASPTPPTSDNSCA